MGVKGERHDEGKEGILWRSLGRETDQRFRQVQVPDWDVSVVRAVGVVEQDRTRRFPSLPFLPPSVSLPSSLHPSPPCTHNRRVGGSDPPSRGPVTFYPPACHGGTVSRALWAALGARSRRLIGLLAYHRRGVFGLGVYSTVQDGYMHPLSGQPAFCPGRPRFFDSRARPLPHVPFSRPQAARRAGKPHRSHRITASSSPPPLHMGFSHQRRPDMRSQAAEWSRPRPGPRRARVGQSGQGWWRAREPSWRFNVSAVNPVPRRFGSLFLSHFVLSCPCLSLPPRRMATARPTGPVGKADERPGKSVRERAMARPLRSWVSGRQSRWEAARERECERRSWRLRASEGGSVGREGEVRESAPRSHSLTPLALTFALASGLPLQPFSRRGSNSLECRLETGRLGSLPWLMSLVYQRSVTGRTGEREVEEEGGRRRKTGRGGRGRARRKRGEGERDWDWVLVRRAHAHPPMPWSSPTV